MGGYGQSGVQSRVWVRGYGWTDAEYRRGQRAEYGWSTAGRATDLAGTEVGANADRSGSSASTYVLRLSTVATQISEKSGESGVGRVSTEAKLIIRLRNSVQSNYAYIRSGVARSTRYTKDKKDKERN